MPFQKKQVEPYDPRWFIWTIVFLLATGISLVSYIVLSDDGTNDVPEFRPSRSTTSSLQ